MSEGRVGLSLKLKEGLGLGLHLTRLDSVEFGWAKLIHWIRAE